MSLLRTGTITRVTSGGVKVQIPSLAPHHEFGPMEIGPFQFEEGDRVLIGQVSGAMEDLVVIAPLLMAFEEEPVGILYYENEAARTADIGSGDLVPVSSTATWLDDEQRLDIYTDEGTPGWVSYYGFKGGVQNLPGGSKIGVGVPTPTSTLDIAATAATDLILQGQQTGDSNRRVTLKANGQLMWGSGSGAQDRSLTRTANGMNLSPRLGINVDPVSDYRLYLETAGGAEGALSIKNTTAAATVPIVQVETFTQNTPIVGLKVNGDTQDRLRIFGNKSEIAMGPGNAARDVSIYRDELVSVGLRIDPRLGVGGSPSSAGITSRINGNVAGVAVVNTDGATHTASAFTVLESGADDSRIFIAFRSGEAQATYRVQLDGTQSWGDGGASALDAFLYRIDVATLRIDDELRVTDVITAGPDDGELGRGLVVHTAFSTSGAAIGTTETTALTTSSATFRANRAFRIVFEGRMTTAGSTNTSPVVQFRKTNLAGAVLINYGRVPTTVIGTQPLNGTQVFKVGGTDVTAAIAMTLQALANTVTHVGDSQGARSVSIYDIGPATLYPNVPTLS